MYMNEYIRQQQNIISLRNCFGLNTLVKNNIWYVGATQQDQTLVYPVGQTLVFHNTAGTDSFLTGRGHGKGITSLSLLPERRYVAIARKGKEPSIDIYDVKQLKLVRQLIFPGLGSEEYVCVDVSEDGKFIVAQGGKPSYNLVLFQKYSDHSAKHNYDMVGHIATSSSEGNPVYQCSISPNNETICVTGLGIFKLLQYDDGLLKNIRTGMGKREPETYLAHCWLNSERLIISNDQGDLFVVEDDDYKILACSPSDGVGLYTISRKDEGFVVGGHNGVVYIFEPVNSEQLYQITMTLHLENPDNLYSPEDLTITNLSYEENNELLACSTRGGQIYTINISSSTLLKDQENLRFSNLTLPFHFKSVTGLDVCVRKPFVATCSKDKTIRIIDYQKFAVVLCQKFAEESYSIALHPSGLSCVIGFADKLKYMKVLGNSLVEEKFFANIRMCPEVRFSNGGHMFAAVNGTVINVYNTYTLQSIYGLRGHTSRVKNIFWKPTDTHIATVGLDGNVFEFQLKHEKRVFDQSVKETQFTGVVGYQNSLLVVGMDGYLRQFQPGEPPNEYNTGESTMTTLAIAKDQNILFSGLEDGSVRVYHLNSLDDFEEQIFTHAGKLLKVIVNYQENLLISISSESIFFYEINKEGHRLSDNVYSEEILINIQDLHDKNSFIKKLEHNFSELKAENDYEQRKKEIEFNERVKDQAENFKIEKNQKIQQWYNLQQEKKNLEKEFESKLKEMDTTHQKCMKDLEHSYNQQIAATMNQIKTLNSKREAEGTNLLQKAKLREEQHQRDIQQQQEYTNDEIRQRQEEINKLEDERSVEKMRHEEIMRQCEADQQILIDKLMKKYQATLDKANEDNLKLSGINTIKENREKAHEKEISLLKSKINDLDLKLSEYSTKLDQKSKETKEVMKENKDREEKIVEKEKKIFELKKKNQELEKYKFVLDYEIGSLNEQIKPSKDMITKLRVKMNDTNIELNTFMNNNQKLKDTIEHLKDKIQSERALIKCKQKSVRDAGIYKDRMHSEVHEIIQHIQNPKKLQDHVIKFYQKYVNEKIQKTGIDYDVQSEYDRQRMHLEKSVDTLKSNLVKVTQKAKSENMRIMHENVVLINEINQLRREARLLKSKLREKEDRLNKDPKGQFMGYGSRPQSALARELQRELEMQQQEINNLHLKLEDLEMMKSRSRPISRELPPIN